MRTIFSKTFSTSLQMSTRDERRNLKEQPAFAGPADYQTNTRLKEWYQVEIAHGGIVVILPFFVFFVVD